MATFYALRKINRLPVGVTTSSSLILPADEQRKFCVFVNDSNENIYLQLGLPAVLNEGIRISANGFSYEIDITNLWVGDVYAIHGGSGAKNLLIMEFS